MEKQSKCSKCGTSFDYRENLKGYSPVSILQLEYCQKCLSQAVNVENALKIYEFNNLMEKEKVKNEKKKTIWEKFSQRAKEKKQKSNKS